MDIVQYVVLAIGGCTVAMFAYGAVRFHLDEIEAKRKERPTRVYKPKPARVSEPTGGMKVAA